MSEIHKVPATAGVQWLLGSFSLFAQAPLQLATLAVTFGFLLSMAPLLTLFSPALGSLIQLLTIFATPVLMGGLVWAVREVAEQRPVTHAALFEGFQKGRLPHLLVAILPYFFASLLLGLLMYLMIGSDGLQRWQEVQAQMMAISQNGGTLEPAQAQKMAESLPVFRFLLWVLITTLTNMAICLMLAFMIPQVMFSRTHGWQALINSLRACLTNLAAMSLFYLATLLGMFVLSMLSAVVMLITSLIVGPVPALMLSMIVMLAIALPIIAGAVYLGWKQMLAPTAAGTPSAPKPSGHVFEA